MTDQHGIGLLLISMGIMVKMVPENKIPTWSSLHYAIAKHSKSINKANKALEEEDDEQGFEDDEERRALV